MDRRRISVEDVEPEEVENIARLMSIFPNEKSAASLINRSRALVAPLLSGMRRLHGFENRIS